MDIIVRGEAEMNQLGKNLASVLEQDDVVYLQGELGAGKTVLVRGTARSLGYEGPVTSPTFTLMNIYPSKPVIYHFDFYRLESPDLADLGMDDYLERGGIVMIEWPQIGSAVLPGEGLWVDIQLVDDDYERERKVHVAARGQKYQDKLERLRQSVDFSHR